MWGDTLPKNRFLRFWVLLAHRYLKHNVATQSAALAFYLLFMIFPFLIFISALLGLLNPERWRALCPSLRIFCRRSCWS